MEGAIIILSTLGLAILAASSWVLVTSFVTRIEQAVHRLISQTVRSKSEVAWARLGLPFGGGLLVLAVILQAGYEVVQSGDDCLIVDRSGQVVTAGGVVDVVCPVSAGIHDPSGDE